MKEGTRGVGGDDTLRWGGTVVPTLMNLLLPVSDNPRLAITTDNTKRCRMHPVYMSLQITEMNVRNNLSQNYIYCTGIICVNYQQEHKRNMRAMPKLSASIKVG